MTPEHPDPLLASLTELAGPLPAAARDARVRARCHAMMTARPVPPRAWRMAAARAFDAMLPLAVVVYGVIAIAEAVKVAGIIASGP